MKFIISTKPVPWVWKRLFYEGMPYELPKSNMLRDVPNRTYAITVDGKWNLWLNGTVKAVSENQVPPACRTWVLIDAD